VFNYRRHSALPDVICGKYVEERGIDLFQAVCKHNLEGVVAKRKTGPYATVSGWLKIKNPNYTQSERRHELFDSLKGKTPNAAKLPPIPKKPPLRAVPLRAKKNRKSQQLNYTQMEFSLRCNDQPKSIRIAPSRPKTAYWISCARVRQSTDGVSLRLVAS
jgi:hypothetical protein